MAYRIGDRVVYGEIDNREKSVVKARIWFAGDPEPINIKLRGNCLSDLAGHSLVFYNPLSKKKDSKSLSLVQEGICGDITASKKSKELTLPPEEIKEAKLLGKKWFSWVNVLYFEWFSEKDGRIVMEIPNFMSVMTTSTWRMTEEEEEAQKKQNEEAIQENLKLVTSGQIPNENLENVEEKELEEADKVLKQIMRIEKLRKNLEGEEGFPEDFDNLPSNLDEEEEFYSGLDSIENPPENTHLDNLLKASISPKESASVSNDDLEFELWKLIFALASNNVFIHNTNHLSNRELYELILNKLLTSDAMMPPGIGWNTHFPMDEFASDDFDECQEVYMRYYMDDKDRERWLEDFPDINMPTHEDPKYFRDNFLPSGYEAIGK